MLNWMGIIALEVLEFRLLSVVMYQFLLPRDEEYVHPL
jgi:hypothetical protein